MADRRAEFYNAVAYHKADTSPEVIAKFEALRDGARQFGDVVFANCQPSREASIALTHIEDALMWAIKQVAINELPVVRP